MLEQREFFDIIEINDSIKEISGHNLQSYNNIFILCKNSFINCNIDINKFINNQLSNEEIQMINKKSPKFNFLFDEFMQFKNNIDKIYIVDYNYLINRGIDKNILNNCILSYSNDNGKKYLSFNEECKMLIIEPVDMINKNKVNQNNSTINNIINIEKEPIDINNNYLFNMPTNHNNIISNTPANNESFNKINILDCLILFYANEKVIKERLGHKSSNVEKINFYLVNKDFINNLKNNFYYSNIINILKINKYEYDNINEYFKYLKSFHSLNEIQKICNNINHINYIEKIKILPSRKNFTNNNDYKWPINFEIVHEKLFKMLLNIYKISQNEMKEINYYQSQYKIYFGYSILYINYMKKPLLFFAFNYDIYNNSYDLFAILKCHENIFLETLLNIKMTFEQYLIQLKIDLNKKNTFQSIKNSQKQIVLEILLFTENNYINNQEQNKNGNIKLINYNDNLFNLSNSSTKRELNHCLGLENIGATCYMNATLQCLCHIRSLKEYFKKKNKFNDNARLSKCFCELINSLWTQSNKGYFTPTNFKNLISELNPLFKGIQANDSKDLIIFIYETIHNELNNPNKNSNYLNNLNNIPEELRLFRESYYSKNNSIISRIFYSEQSSNLLCCSCNVNKLSFNVISFLIFPLEKVRQYLEKVKYGNLKYVTLEDCFEQNENKENLSGSNQIFCNSCNRSANAISYNRLYNCPEVLTIILNRGKGIEFDVQFKFPMYINIKKYVEDKNCNTNYELIGLITHLGESGMSGHFIAYCKSPADNDWYYYNDAQVTKCVDPDNEINSCGIPYVLFYQKKNNSFPEITNEKTPVDGPKYNNENNKFVLYFTYEDKEGYVELNGDYMLFDDVINKIYEKYNWVPQTGVGFYKQGEDEMIEIDKYKTISQNVLKYGEKIIIA